MQRTSLILIGSRELSEPNLLESSNFCSILFEDWSRDRAHGNEKDSDMR